MKRFIVLAALLLLAVTAHAKKSGQKPSEQMTRREQKEAQKLEKQLEIAQMIDSLILERSFQFNPEEVSFRNGRRIFLKRYQYLKIFPGRYYVGLPYAPRLDGFFRQGTFQSLELQDNLWLISVDMDYHTGILNFEFSIDRLTGKATVRMRNKKSVPVVYIGNIYPN